MENDALTLAYSKLKILEREYLFSIMKWSIDSIMIIDNT